MAFPLENWKELCMEMEQFDQHFFEQFKSEMQDFTSAKLDNVKITRGKEAVFGNWLVRFAEMYSSTRDFTIAAGQSLWI